MQGRVAPCNSTGRGHPRSQHKAVSDDTLLPPRPPTLSHLKPCFEFHHFALAFSVLASERPLHLNDLSVGSLRWKAPSVCVTRHHEPLPLSSSLRLLPHSQMNACPSCLLSGFALGSGTAWLLSGLHHPQQRTSQSGSPALISLPNF